MSPLSTKILLCIVLCLSICQYTQSQYVFGNPSDAIVLYTINEEAITNIGEVSTPALKFTSFPYMVTVHKIFGEYSAPCAGTILSKRWVLTAAHCVEKNPGTLLVDFDVDEFCIEQGILRTLKFTPSLFSTPYVFGNAYSLLRPGVMMIPTQTFIHPQYAKGYNDIALLYMPQDIPFSNNIQPIKLAYCESFVNKDAYVVGWRKQNTTSESTVKTMKLMYATLPIIENNVCSQYWAINDKHICTAAELGQFACSQRTDSDALIIRNNGQDFQIGIMNYLDQSCYPNKLPQAYTKVSSYIDWIIEVTKRY